MAVSLHSPSPGIQDPKSRPSQAASYFDESAALALSSRSREPALSGVEWGPAVLPTSIQGRNGSSAPCHPARLGAVVSSALIP
jgi:hypothetical protein